MEATWAFEALVSYHMIAWSENPEDHGRKLD